MAEPLPDASESPPPFPNGMPPWAGAETFAERADRLALGWDRNRAMSKLGKLAAIDAMLLVVVVVALVFSVSRIVSHPRWDAMEKLLASAPLLLSVVGAVILGLATESMMRNSFELRGGVARALLFGAGGTALAVLGLSAFALFIWKGADPLQWGWRIRPHSGWVCWGAGLSVLVVIPAHLWILVTHGRTLHPDHDAPLS